MSQVPPFADLSRNHSKDAALVPLEVSAEIEGDGRTHLVCCPRGEREHYTSMCCGRCGVLHRKLSGRMFKCPSCDMKIGRDFNGARDIFMMNVESCVGR